MHHVCFRVVAAVSLAALALVVATPAAAQPRRMDVSSLTGPGMPSNEMVVFGGLNHAPIGDAKIAVVGDELVVTNLGPAGDDGVLVQLGQAEGWGFEFDDLTLDEPLGSFKEWVMRGTLDSVPDQVLWTERHELTEVEGQRVIQVSFDSTPLGATQNVLRVYDQGAMVYQGVFPPGPLYHFFAEEIDPPPMRHAAQWDATCVKMPIDPKNWPIKTADGAVIREFDTIINYPLDATGQVGFHSAVESRANVPHTALRHEVLVALDELLAHRALGGARFNAANGRLGLFQLGASGADGVSIELGAAEGADVFWGPLDMAGAAPPGSFVHASARGLLNGQPDQPLGDLRLTKLADSRIEVTVDFSNIASPTHRIQVVDDGQIIAEIPGHSGVVALASRWPNGLGKLGGELECYIGTFPDGTEIDVDGVVFQADELRVLAETPSAIGAKNAFDVRAAGLGQITLVQEVVKP